MMSKKPSVLIVEDDTWLAEQNARVLEQAGYNAYISPHAISGIDDVDWIKPDVIILDILLPGVTGFGLLHEMQSHKDMASIPVILCSSATEGIKLEDVKPYGVQRILDKTTMTPDDVVAAVRGVLL